MNKLTVIIAVLLFSLSSVYAQSGMQSGKYLVNSTATGYTLDKNTGDRSYSIEVTFKKPFDAKPILFLSVTTLDADGGTNTRYSVEAVSVSRDGFTIKISTWSDSKVYGIGGDWIARIE